MTPSLPALTGRTLLSVDGTTVSWTDLQGETHQTPLSEWLDLVPAYVSTYPYGNKVSDEAAECAHGVVMQYWRGVLAARDSQAVVRKVYTLESVSAALGMGDSPTTVVDTELLCWVIREMERLREIEMTAREVSDNFPMLSEYTKEHNRHLLREALARKSS